MKAQRNLHAANKWRWKMHTLLHRAGSWLGAIVAILLLSQSAWAADTEATPSPHTFTDSLGRTLQASLLRVTNPDVYLMNGSGYTIHTKISDFTAADQAYILQWAKAQAQADLLAASALVVSATPNHITGDGRASGPQSFKLSLKNLSNKPLTGLTASYVLFRLPGLGGKIAQFPLPRLAGDNTIKTIAANSTLNFDSIPLTNGDAPLAIWIRVYSSDGSIVQEYCSMPDIMQFENWDKGNVITNVDASGREITMTPNSP
jgi:hypothetical protein